MGGQGTGQNPQAGCSAVPPGHSGRWASGEGLSTLTGMGGGSCRQCLDPPTARRQKQEWRGGLGMIEARRQTPVGPPSHFPRILSPPDPFSLNLKAECMFLLVTLADAEFVPDCRQYVCCGRGAPGRQVCLPLQKETRRSGTSLLPELPCLPCTRPFPGTNKPDLSGLKELSNLCLPERRQVLDHGEELRADVWTGIRLSLQVLDPPWETGPQFACTLQSNSVFVGFLRKGTQGFLIFFLLINSNGNVAT